MSVSSEVRSKNLPSKRSSLAIAPLSTRSRALFGPANKAIERRRRAQLADELVAALLRPVVRSLDLLFEIADEVLADPAVARRDLGVVADTEALGPCAVAEADLLHLQVAGDVVITPGARRVRPSPRATRRGRARRRCSGRRPSADRRGCASELKPESATHTTRFSIQPARSSLIVLMIAWSEVVPGKVQQRIGIPSAVTAMPSTTWGRSGRWSFECL